MLKMNLSLCLPTLNSAPEVAGQKDKEIQNGKEIMLYKNIKISTWDCFQTKITIRKDK